MNRIATSLICLPLLLSVFTACQRSEDKHASASGNGAVAEEPANQLDQPIEEDLAADQNAARKMAPLMSAVFGKDYSALRNDALVGLPNPDNRSKTDVYMVSPVASTVLENGETVLIANANLAHEDGHTMSVHASSGLLNVYFLRQEEGQWKLIRRQENIASLGSFGHIGEVVWLSLASGKPGLGVLHGGTWQGYSITFLSLFDLTAPEMRDLTQNAIEVHSDNDGGCGPDTSECWNISGKWRFVAGKSEAGYDDLVLDFSGEKARLPANKPYEEGSEAKRISSKVQSSARYAFDGKHYRLVSGENVVPGI